MDTTRKTNYIGPAKLDEHEIFVWVSDKATIRSNNVMIYFKMKLKSNNELVIGGIYPDDLTAVYLLDRGKPCHITEFEIIKELTLKDL